MSQAHVYDDSVTFYGKLNLMCVELDGQQFTLRSQKDAAVPARIINLVVDRCRDQGCEGDGNRQNDFFSRLRLNAHIVTKKVDSNKYGEKEPTQTVSQRLFTAEIDRSRSVFIQLVMRQN